MAFNQVMDMYNTCSRVVFGVQAASEDMDNLNLGSYKDPDRNVHSFFYKEDGSDPAVTRNQLVKIYEAYYKDNPLSMYWRTKIDQFENTFRVDFFTLLSYIYLYVSDNGKDEKLIQTTSGACTILTRDPEDPAVKEEYYNQALQKVSSERPASSYMEDIMEAAPKNVY